MVITGMSGQGETNTNVRHRCLQAMMSAFRDRMRDWRRAGLDLLYPPICANCSAELPALGDRAPFCTDCCQRLFPPLGPVCQRCGSPLTEAGSAHPGCNRCRGRVFHFDAAFALGTYRGDLQTAVLRMKGFPGEFLSVATGRLMAERLGPKLAERHPELVAPVPIHWSRRFLRGTNSPEVLARPLGRQLRIPVFSDLLRWRRNTNRQSTLLPRQRFRNVRGALRVSPSYDIGDAHILVVDDILTTGATASESARELRQAGAAKVTVAVVACATGEG